MNHHNLLRGRIACRNAIEIRAFCLYQLLSGFLQRILSSISLIYGHTLKVFLLKTLSFDQIKYECSYFPNRFLCSVFRNISGENKCTVKIACKTLLRLIFRWRHKALHAIYHAWHELKCLPKGSLYRLFAWKCFACS